MSELPIVLIFGAFVSSLISGTTGLAGGAVLMGFLAFYLSPVEAIVLHGLLQLFSNFSRVVIFFRWIEWRAFLYFSLLAGPGVFLGTLCLGLIPEMVVKIILGLMIVISALKIKPQNLGGPSNIKVFWGLGFLSGFVGSLAGVVGPVLAPFFLKAGLSKERLIGTKAICQMLVQGFKVIFFASILNVDYRVIDKKILIMIAAIFAGSYCAKSILGRIQNQQFESVLKYILILVGLKILLDPLL